MPYLLKELQCKITCYYVLKTRHFREQDKLGPQQREFRQEIHQVMQVEAVPD
ncbi:hypothetical protein ACO1B4_06105 [Staphylococcus lugdunensis]|uniref:hypothetical protein n=1 Tax=Staphylococcus lugdunensis TaxID=28035 RepID=UPI000213A21E|nr:hypothetical protein [Staphylococcus lugdunensis]EHS02854.1 hypothetical protein SEVCU139_1119 [Staphylococcus lugdunensis VCU139]MCO6567210.1 hypothetical protein [Staphylococcus lugdunensis]MDK7914666.1 hypothetical protein [Staphylococcus lugdunensis]CCB54629.1 hypothetical protein SLUG_21060 [Staphylococcus lugdunensis N920143]